MQKLLLLTLCCLAALGSSAQTCPTSLVYDLNNFPNANYDNEAEADFFRDEDGSCPPGQPCDQLFSYRLTGAVNGEAIDGIGNNTEIVDLGGQSTLRLTAVDASNTTGNGLFSGDLDILAGNGGNLTCTYTDGVLAPPAVDPAVCPTSLLFDLNNFAQANFNTEADADFLSDMDGTCPPGTNCNQLFNYRLNGTVNGETVDGIGNTGEISDEAGQASLLLLAVDTKNTTGNGLFDGSLTLFGGSGSNATCTYTNSVLSGAAFAPSTESCPTSVFYDSNGFPQANFDTETEADFYRDETGSCPPNTNCNQLQNYRLNGTVNGEAIDGIGNRGESTDEADQASVRLTATDVTNTTGNGFFDGTLTLFASNGGSQECVYTASVLPVAYTDWTAARRGAGVQLYWQTATEVNNARFYVQRSTDGRRFTTVGTVAGAGYSERALAYQFADAGAPAGLLYYRLQQKDFDGTTSWSEVRTVAAQPGVAPRPTLLGNPVTPGAALRVRVPGTAPAPVMLVLHDLTGRRVRSTPLTAGTTTLATTGLSAGTYLLRTVGLPQELHQRVIIQ